MIKKFIQLIFYIGLLVFIYNVYLLYNHYKTIEDQEIQSQIQTLQNQVNQLSKVEQKEEIAKIKLNSLHNPEIINDKLEEVSSLLVYRGEIIYTDHLKESSFWGTKGLALNLKYKFGITYSLEDVIVDSFYEDTVVIKLPKDKLELEYIEIHKDSKVESSNGLLVSKFSPEQIEIIFEQANDRVRNMVENDKDIYDKAFKSLKFTLNDLILKLGYEKVVFDVL